MKQELLLVNANVYTFESSRPKARNVLISQGKIKALDEVPSCLSYEIIDLKGKTVLPGFIDSHNHFLWTAISMIAPDLKGLSLQEIQKRLLLSSGDFLLGIGLPGEDKELLLQLALYVENQFPHKLVFLLGETAHFSLVNSYTLDSLKIDSKQGLEVNARGRPSGILKGKAHSEAFQKITHILLARFPIDSGLRKAAQSALSRGITTIHAFEGGFMGGHDAVRTLLKKLPSLPLHFLVWDQSMDVEKVVEMGLSRIGGCLPLDGDFAPRTAALLEPYSDSLGNGILYYSQEEINQFVSQAHRRKMQVALHAVGDRAVEQALEAFEFALEHYPLSDHRHRIEHAELITHGQREKARKLNITFSLQPTFNYLWNHESHRPYLGERIYQVDPIGSLYSQGLMCAFGSDSFITPMDPLLWIHSAINHSNERERLSLDQALRMSTLNAAFIGFEEKDKGSISPGKLADLVVLEEDPYAVGPGSLKDIKVLMTIVQGQIEYSF